jgi:hypothetical protein
LQPTSLSHTSHTSITRHHHATPLHLYYDSSDLLPISILQLQRITTLECGKEKRNHLLYHWVTHGVFLSIFHHHRIIRWLHREQRGLDSGLSLISLFWRPGITYMVGQFLLADSVRSKWICFYTQGDLAFLFCFFIAGITCRTLFHTISFFTRGIMQRADYELLVLGTQSDRKGLDVDRRDHLNRVSYTHTN